MFFFPPVLIAFIDVFFTSLSILFSLSAKYSRTSHRNQKNQGTNNTSTTYKEPIPESQYLSHQP